MCVCVCVCVCAAGKGCYSPERWPLQGIPRQVPRKILKIRCNILFPSKFGHFAIVVFWSQKTLKMSFLLATRFGFILFYLQHTLWFCAVGLKGERRRFRAVARVAGFDLRTR